MKGIYHTWETSLPGVVLIIVAAWDLYHQKQITQNAIMTATAGWGFLMSQSIKNQKK